VAGGGNCRYHGDGRGEVENFANIIPCPQRFDRSKPRVPRSPTNLFFLFQADLRRPTDRTAGFSGNSAGTGGPDFMPPYTGDWIPYNIILYIWIRVIKVNPAKAHSLKRFHRFLKE